MRIATICIVLLAALTMTACNAMDNDTLFWGEGVSGSGNTAKDVRTFSALHGVRLSTIGDLRVEVGDRNQLTIEADDNLLKYFATSVDDGILRIKVEDGVSMRTHSAVRFHLVTTSLDYLSTSSSGDIVAKDLKEKEVHISASSSGDITVRDIDGKRVHLSTSSSGDLRIANLMAQELEVSLSSSGDVTIREGSAERQEVRISSSGDYDAVGLRTQRATIKTSSSGDAKVWVIDKLRASTSSSGSIHFRGGPDVEAHSSSSGDIEPLR
ncbi:DUF2807 domain-containing protein [bacterium]|nr:DUF2807 domain-containing protein [bacterium]